MVHETLSQKYPTQNRTGGVSQVVELPSKHEALSSSLSTTKKKRKKEKIRSRKLKAL
jgi:hypothetical protein